MLVVFFCKKRSIQPIWRNVYTKVETENNMRSKLLKLNYERKFKTVNWKQRFSSSGKRWRGKGYLADKYIWKKFLANYIFRCNKLRKKNAKAYETLAKVKPEILKII